MSSPMWFPLFWTSDLSRGESLPQGRRATLIWWAKTSTPDDLFRQADRRTPLDSPRGEFTCSGRRSACRLAVALFRLAPGQVQIPRLLKDDSG